MPVALVLNFFVPPLYALNIPLLTIELLKLNERLSCLKLAFLTRWFSCSRSCLSFSSLVRCSDARRILDNREYLASSSSRKRSCSRRSSSSLIRCILISSACSIRSSLIRACDCEVLKRFWERLCVYLFDMRCDWVKLRSCDKLRSRSRWIIRSSNIPKCWNLFYSWHPFLENSKIVLFLVYQIVTACVPVVHVPALVGTLRTVSA